MLIGFGGGSSIDTAKAVRAMLANPGKPVQAFEGIGKVVHVGPPLVAISTTSGTAAEVTSNAVITDTQRKVKMVLIDSALIPDIAVNDPELIRITSYNVCYTKLLRSTSARPWLPSPPPRAPRPR